MAKSGNVDLSTVPSRDAVQLTIYNSEDLTLVRDRPKITFKVGENPLQFSWANTQIDPTSVQLKFVTQGDRLEVLDTTFPHDRPQLLRWNVKSEFDGEATVEISYFTSGITWSADYLCVADKDEETLSVEGSGECDVESDWQTNYLVSCCAYRFRVGKDGVFLGLCEKEIIELSPTIEELQQLHHEVPGKADAADLEFVTADDLCTRWRRLFARACRTPD